MNEYVQIEFPGISTEKKDILIAELSEIGFEGFEEKETMLQAFIPLKEFNENALNEIAGQQGITLNKTIIEETDWNAVWESNFEPVTVDDFVTIRAAFHRPSPGVQYEIIITPKMSFGTGHHATTFMMIQQMKQMDFAGKTVMDFGTGTGVLAILAEKMGARKIIAIDNDDRSIENAGENIQRNACLRIDLLKAAKPPVAQSFDIILANINKNVILENFDLLFNQFSAGSVLLLSGLLKEDKDDILQKVKLYSLQLVQTAVRDNWLTLKCCVNSL